MNRVLHYVGIMNRGGMETFIMNLYRNIDRAKVQFDFAVHSSIPGDYDNEIKLLGGNIIVFPAMRRNPTKYCVAWDKFWRENSEKYSAFHFHTNSLANIIALKKAKKYNVKKIIVHSHSSYANKGKLQVIHNILHKYNQYRIMNYVDLCYSCSIPAAEWLYGKKFCKKDKVIIINNGIELEKFSFNCNVRKKIRKEFGISDEEIVIGHIGKFIDVKNHNFLIDIFKEYSNINPKAKLMLIGDGILIPKVRNKVLELDINDNVIFTGVKSNVNELFQSMDIFIFPSFYEGLPLTLVEAQASGIPVIASSNIAKEIKMKGNFVFMDISISPHSWAKEINNIIQKDNNRITDNTSLRDNGYSIKDIAKKYQEIIVNYGR